jgi:hypothetical protein
MSETPSSSEPATGPVTTATTPPPQPPTAPPAYVERDREPRRGRLTAVAAWVGIVAGVVFIIAVVFFSGFIIGAHTGGHRGGGYHDFGMIERGGPPAMFPRGQFERPMPPFAGPGSKYYQPPQATQPPQPPQSPGAPTTTAPARP